MDEFLVGLEKIKDHLPTGDAWGMVFYSDGGYRPNTKACGWGIHGYLYNHDERKQGYGLKQCDPTNAGYVGPAIRTIDEVTGKALRVTLVNNCTEVKPVNISAYIDGYGSLVGSVESNVTNNVAELVALLKILVIMNRYKPPKAQIIADSTYVLKGAIKNVHDWAKRNFEGIANADYWKEIYLLLVAVKANGTVISWDWTKGHRDDIGNIRADYSAGIAMNAQQNESERDHLQISPTQKYWNPAIKVNPLLRTSRIYFKPIPTDPASTNFYYYLGNNGGDSDNENTGQPNADKGYAVIKLPEADYALESLKQYFIAKAMKNPHVPIVTIRNDILINPKVHTDITTHGALHLRSDHTTLNSVVFTPNKQVLAWAPAHNELLFKAEEYLAGMHSLLDSVLGDNLPTTATVTDVTPLFFGTYPKGKTTTVVKPHPNTTGYIEVDIPVKTSIGVITKKTGLSYGLSLPTRNMLSAVAEFNPICFVVSWIESEFTARYAFVLRSDTGSGIWCAAYSNILFLSKLLISENKEK